MNKPWQHVGSPTDDTFLCVLSILFYFFTVSISLLEGSSATSDNAESGVFLEVNGDQAMQGVVFCFDLFGAAMVVV